MPAYRIQQSTAVRPLYFKMTDSSTGAAKTGLTCTVKLLKNGGSFADPAGAVSEVANGVYKVAANATDSNTVGPLLLYATGSGANPTWETYEVTPNPVDSYDSPLIPNGFGTVQSGTTSAIGLQHALGASAVVTNCPVMVWNSSGNVQVTRASGYAELAGAGSLSVSPSFSPAIDTSFNYAIFATRVPALDSNGRNQIQSGTSAGQLSLTSGVALASLASTGLDNVSVALPSGAPATFRDWIIWLAAMRFGGKVIYDAVAKTIVVYAADGTTIVTTQTFDVEATTETQGALH